MAEYSPHRLLLRWSRPSHPFKVRPVHAPTITVLSCVCLPQSHQSKLHLQISCRNPHNNLVHVICDRRLGGSSRPLRRRTLSFLYPLLLWLLRRLSLTASSNRPVTFAYRLHSLVVYAQDTVPIPYRPLRERSELPRLSMSVISRRAGLLSFVRRISGRRSDVGICVFGICDVKWCWWWSVRSMLYID